MDRKIALKGVLIYLAMIIQSERDRCCCHSKNITRKKRRGIKRRKEEVKRRGSEEKRGESRPIRAPRQGNLCLIRRSQLVEAVRTGIHIRYGLGSGFTLGLVFLARTHDPHSLYIDNTRNSSASSFPTSCAEFQYLILYIYLLLLSIQLYTMTICGNFLTQLCID